MSDATTTGGTPENLNPPSSNSFGSKANVALLAGMAITPDDGGGGAIIGTFDKALASASLTARCCGLAARNADVNGDAICQFAGMLGLTEAQWDNVLTDASGTGLTPRAYYYVSASVAGKLTRTAPVGGNYVTPVGLAISNQVMLVLVQLAVVTSS